MRNRLIWLLAGWVACHVAVAQTGSIQLLSYRRGLYRAPVAPRESFADSPRIESLVRAGNLYLSLHDAIALALENNLDIEFNRLDIPIAQSDTLRAKGGGNLRGVSTSFSEVPAGIGGPGAPLLTATATGTVQTSPLVGYSSDLAIISEAVGSSPLFTTNLFAPGPPVPSFDPSLNAQFNYEKMTTPETSLVTSGSASLVTRTINANAEYLQGFSPGTLITGGFNNAFNRTSSVNSIYNPYSSANLNLTVTQPLLRGFGVALNRRYIRIAKNNEKISDLVFREQLIVTVSGVIRLYQDLVALNEDVVNRRETLTLAQRLYEDNKTKVDVGTLAPVELTRAQAQVAAARQDLINAEGYVAQQELILKTVLTRRGTANGAIRNVHIVATDVLEVPSQPDTPDAGELIRAANQNRPDLQYAGIQIDNSEIALEGSLSELKPELDLVGTVQNSGLAGSVNSAYAPISGAPLPATLPFQGGYGDVLGQLGAHNYPTYEIGLNLTLPLRNRVAQADAIRDELQVRQNEVKRQQLVNQARLEVEDALVALNRSRESYETAVETRKLQEQSLAIEQERYSVGLSTTFLVLQYQSYLAQARTTEIAAKSTYAKSRTALDRATGLTLERNSVSVAEAYRGKVQTASSVPPR